MIIIIVIVIGLHIDFEHVQLDIHFHRQRLCRSPSLFNRCACVPLSFFRIVTFIALKFYDGKY